MTLEALVAVCVTACITTCCFGLICARTPAQVVKRKPSQSGQPQHAGNAAPVYLLAAAELPPKLVPLVNGFAKPRRLRPGQIQLARGNFVVGANLVIKELNDEGAPDQWSKPVAESVVARGLFAQASTRGRCVFARRTDGQTAIHKRHLAVLARLVHHHGRLALGTNPIATCDDACTVLRYVRHVGSGVGFEQVLPLMEVEQDALALLRDGLEGIVARGGKASLPARYEAELSLHSEQRFASNDFASVFVASVPELVEQQCPRLRDVLAREPGGFVAKKMCERLQRVLRDILGVPGEGGQTLNEWLKRSEAAQAKALPKPVELSSVRYRVDYGMVQLVLAGRTSLWEGNRASAVELGRCRELLDRLVK